MCIFGEYLDQTTKECTLCPMNEYCELDGATAGVTCPNGFNCVTGTPIRGPNLTSALSPNFHLCDEGKFCDSANDAANGVAGRPTDCPVGTFMPTIGA
jgi:hypothetical protein